MGKMLTHLHLHKCIHTYTNTHAHTHTSLFIVKSLRLEMHWVKAIGWYCGSTAGSIFIPCREFVVPMSLM